MKKLVSSAIIFLVATLLSLLAAFNKNKVASKQ